MLKCPYQPGRTVRPALTYGFHSLTHSLLCFHAQPTLPLFIACSPSFVACFPFTHSLLSFYSKPAFPSFTNASLHSQPTHLSLIAYSSLTHSFLSFHSQLMVLHLESVLPSLTICSPFTHSLVSSHSKPVLPLLTAFFPHS